MKSKFLFRAFIPSSYEGSGEYIKQFRNGKTGLPTPETYAARMLPGGLGPNEYFATDERLFSSELSASARIRLLVEVTRNSRHFLQVDRIESQHDVGETHLLRGVDGSLIEKKRADANPDNLKVGPITIEGMKSRFEVSFSIGNPFYSLGPKIDLELFIERNALTKKITLKGNIGAFPAFEGYFSVENGPWRSLFQIGPVAGTTATSLFDLNIGINTRPILVSVLDT